MSLEAFPGAIPVEDYVRRTVDAVAGHGLVPGVTLAMVSVCRDELSDALTEPISAAWGRPFRMGGLAGMLFLGQAGLNAGRHHAPEGDGRRRYAVYVMPHIGVGPDGTPGQVARPGQTEPTTACGALMALRGGLGPSAAQDELDPFDPELGLLRRRLAAAVPPGADPAIVELTALTRDAILADLGELLDRMGGWRDSAVAVFSGIHIHTPDGDYVQPGHSALRMPDAGDIPLRL